MTASDPTSSKLGFEKVIPGKPTLLGDLFWALLYAGLGILALSLTVPPGYAAPFFPAAGIAIAAVGFRGARGLVSVVLGSLAVQVMAWWQVSGEFALTLSSALIPLFAGLQAAVAIWLAAWLRVRLLQLEAPDRVLRLLLLVVPLSCIVNAGLSVPLLVAVGGVAPEHFWFNFWSWWLGDTLGAMIALPMAVLLLIPQPMRAGFGRRWFVIILLLASLLAALALLQMGTWERDRIRADFDSRAASLHRQIERALQDKLSTLTALHSHAQAGGVVSDPAAFADFVLPWLRSRPGILNMSYNPLVTPESREFFESRLHTQGQSIGILDRDSSSNRLVPAQDREVYFPIAVVEPIDRNRVVLGLDPRSVTVAAAAIDLARQRREPIASASFLLAQEQSNQRGVVVYWPVWLTSAQPPVELGLVSMALRIEDAVRAAMVGGSEPANLWLCLVDVSASAQGERLMGPEGCERRSFAGEVVSWSSDLSFASRQWQLRILPTIAYLEEQRSWAAWVLMLVLVLAVALLAAFMLLLSGQTRRIEVLVQERTQQLNEALSRVEQQKTELALLAHQDSLTGLPNRTHWLQLAERALAQTLQSQRPLAVAFLDLDGFKAVNDQKGHHAGDLLLQGVAQRVQSVMRNADALARHGGDEFVLLLPGLNSDTDAAPVAQRVVEVLAQPFDLDEQIGRIEISVSLGLAVWPRHGQTIDELLRAADLAMYRAKALGRNRWAYPE